MRQFAQLYRSLDEASGTNAKVDALVHYFSRCESADGAWAVYFLVGQRIKRLIPSREMRQWAAQTAGIEDWLFEACYDSVGDLAETMSLLVAAASELTAHNEQTDEGLAHWIESRVLPLGKLEEQAREQLLHESWNLLSNHERFVFNKIVTGGFRVGVSKGLVIRALAKVADLETSVIAHRLMGSWEPTSQFFESLLSRDDGTADASKPYPFMLANPLQEEPNALGSPGEWLAEWKWDGIRAQVLRRGGNSFVWSRGEELILQRFPELHDAIAQLPDGTVLDGEIVAWKDERVMSFADLQKRIGRKKVGKKLLGDVPCRFIAFDILEHHGKDIRSLPLSDRRERILQVVEPIDDSALQTSTALNAESWDALAEQREESRYRGTEGLMLKRLDAKYEVGRPAGLWWKWKVDPFVCDAVLIYAQRGHGRRSNLYTDYTFAAWDDGQLVPFAKAYSGLTDEDIRKVDRFIRKNTLEKFGPVRSVKPELVFELAFEGIHESKRHKSGVAVRFPRISRWRHDKPIDQADTLAMIKSMAQLEVV
ncbi:ATP-dependent DNA ligase [Bremerella sp.]|uniref:ATP-dependent DNA ligase n=1 Tax=Bremerella sp. TaxID=2795602 RepID=UPI003918AE54